MERRIRNHFFCFQNTQAKSKKERKADPQCPARKLWLSPGAIVPNENFQNRLFLKKQIKQLTAHRQAGLCPATHNGSLLYSESVCRPTAWPPAQNRWHPRNKVPITSQQDPSLFFKEDRFNRSALLGLHPPQKRAAVIMFGWASCSHHSSKLHLNATLWRIHSSVYHHDSCANNSHTDAACPPDSSLIDGTDVF